MRSFRQVLIPMCGIVLMSNGCTPFATVHPATIEPGVNVTFQAAMTTPPGDDAAWFWSYDCESGCNHAIIAPDLGIQFGSEFEGGLPFQLGAGISGLSGYAEIYKQLGDRPGHPWGLGGRLGIPITNWTEHRLYGRFERPAGDQSLVLNPTLYVFTGNSPNGANPGTFIAFVQGVGLVDRRERTTVIPALAAGIGRGSRENYGTAIGPFTTFFATASISIIVHRQRER